MVLDNQLGESLILIVSASFVHSSPSKDGALVDLPIHFEVSTGVRIVQVLLGSPTVEISWM